MQCVYYNTIEKVDEANADLQQGHHYAVKSDKHRPNGVLHGVATKPDKLLVFEMEQKGLREYTLSEFKNVSPGQPMFCINHPKELVQSLEETMKMIEDVKKSQQEKWPGYKVEWNNQENFAVWLKTKRRLDNDAEKSFEQELNRTSLKNLKL